MRIIYWRFDKKIAIEKVSQWLTRIPVFNCIAYDNTQSIEAAGTNDAHGSVKDIIIKSQKYFFWSLMTLLSMCIKKRDFL